MIEKEEEEMSDLNSVFCLCITSLAPNELKLQSECFRSFNVIRVWNLSYFNH